MSANKKDLEIVSKLAEEIASKSEGTKEKGNTNDLQEIPFQNNDKDKEKSKKLNINGNKLTAKDLTLRKKSQNLVERKILLWILAALLGVQLLFMNIIVLLIVLWNVFNWSFFQPIDADILGIILEFSKYYVTAVLVELLSGIIYIIHRVFTDDK